MKPKTSFYKWHLLAGLMVAMLCCVLFAQSGMAQSTTSFRVAENGPTFINNVLSLAVGEVVTLNVVQDDSSPEKIQWALQYQKADGTWECVLNTDEDFANHPFQLYGKIDTDNSTVACTTSPDKNIQRNKDGSVNTVEARAASYGCISVKENSQSTVFLKAVKAIPSSSKYRVCLHNGDCKNPLHTMEIGVKGPPSIRLVPRQGSLLNESEIADSYHIEAGTKREFQLKFIPESGGHIDIDQVFVTPGAAAKLMVVGSTDNVQEKFELKDNSVDIGVIALQDSKEPVDLIITNQQQQGGDSKEDLLIKETIPFHIVRPKISIVPPALSLMQNAEGNVTVNIDTGNSGLTPQGKIEWESNNIAIPVPKQVTILEDSKSTSTYLVQSALVGDGTLKAKYVVETDKAAKDKTFLSSAEALLGVNIRPAPNIVVYDGPSTLLIGRAEKIKITLYDQSFKPVEDVDRYRFTVRSGTPEVLSVRRHPELPGVVEVTALKPGVARLEVLVNGVALPETWELRAATVSEFKPVRVALNIMDDKTAADLFGKQTSKEFYAVRVRVFNNLDRDVDGRFLGKSILAYSESIEASVGLETKEAPIFATGKERKRYEANMREIKERDVSKIKREIKKIEKDIKDSEGHRKRKEKLEKELKEYQLKLAMLDAWHELSPRDPAITQNYDLPMANPDNPYPFGLVTSTEAPYRGVSNALGSGASARFGNAFPVTVLHPGQKAIFNLPEGISPPPGAAVHLWSEDCTDKSLKTQTSTKSPVVEIDQNFGIATMKNTGITMISVIVGSKRYSCVIEVKHGDVSKELQKVQLHPVSQLESGNNMAIEWEESTAPKNSSPGEIEWNYLKNHVPSQTAKFTVVTNKKDLLLTGVIDGTEAIVSKEIKPKDKDGKEKDAEGQRYAAVVNVILSDPTTNLPPSVYIDANGQPKYFQHMFRYRPYTFEMMVNSAPERNKRDGRTRTFNLLNGLLSATSVYSLFNRDNDTAHNLGLLSRFAQPIANSYMPDLSDAQRQNFVAMTMKPLEEIPFGSDISRVIFFPKTPFRGMVKDRLTRINRIDTSYFNITVSILDKSTATLNAVVNEKE